MTSTVYIFNFETYLSATIIPVPKILPPPGTCPLFVPGREAVGALMALDCGRLRTELGGLPAMFTALIKQQPSLQIKKRKWLVFLAGLSLHISRTFFFFFGTCATRV